MPTPTKLAQRMLEEVDDVQHGVRPSTIVPIDPDAIKLKDDAYHLAEFKGDANLFWYVEWWYFNFHDRAQGVSGMVTFAVFNPTDEHGLGACSLNAAVFEPGGKPVTLKMDYHGTRQFSASPDEPDVTLAGSQLRTIDRDTLHVNAVTEDGSTKMDLIYRQADAPASLANSVTGTRPWEVSSWLAFMPSARVSGTLEVNGNRYEIDQAAGYHDHDWGQWRIPDDTWAWAAFNDPDKQIAFDVGLHAAFQQSTAYFRFGDERLHFRQGAFKSRMRDWVRWEVLWKYPRVTDFTAVDETGQYKLDLTWTVQATASLWKYPLIVFEQSAGFVGRLSRKTTAGWQTVIAIDEPGFCEYTSKWLGGGPED